MMRLYVFLVDRTTLAALSTLMSRQGLFLGFLSWGRRLSGGHFTGSYLKSKRS